MSETIEQLSGKHLYYGFLAGAKNIFDQQGYLNKINVFPVPDADTGTNMASTMHAIIDNAVPSNHLKDAATSISDAALVGARGNSGIIFAQYLYGISNELPNEESLGTIAFAKSVRKAVDYAYESIANPVEGTIITMLREWSIKFDELAQTQTDFITLFKESYEYAKDILADISKLLEKLAKAKVVDAGAQGIVFFLQGVVEFLENQSIKEIIQSRSQVQQLGEEFNIDHEEITFRYCTECLISGEDFNKEEIRKSIGEMGDSLVIAGSRSKMRIHIHTDQPANVYNKITQFGEIVYQKVDDMIFQQEVSEHRKNNIALVIDSCADLPKSFIDEHQIHVVPLNLHIGNSQFLDRITITSDQFYEQLNKLKDLPTTSQPSKKDFTNKFNYLTGKYESIISLCLSSKLSGTYSNCYTAAKKVSEDRGTPINVVDTKCASGAFGLIAELTAEAIKDGHSVDEILMMVEEWKSKAFLLIAPSTLKFFIRGGRLSRPKGFIANLLNMRPVVSMNREGGGITLKSYFGHTGSINGMADMFADVHKTKGIERYCVLYTNKEDLQKAEEFANHLELICGQKTAYIMQISPVLGTNGGPGAIEVSYITK